MIVTIDGSSGIGKTSTARCVAERLGFVHLVGGVFLRSLTYRCIILGLKDQPQIIELAKVLNPTIISTKNRRDIFLEGKSVTEFLWLPDVDQLVPEIANILEVRDIRRQWLLSFSKGKNIVADGRTLGTEIFPQAEFKFYIICNLIERSRRNGALGNEKNLKLFLERDEEDNKSTIKDFAPASDAKIIDTTAMSLSEVVDVIVSTVERSETYLSRNRLPKSNL